MENILGTQVGEGELATARDSAVVRARGKEMAATLSQLDSIGWKLAVGFGQLKLGGCESQRERDTSGWVWLAES